jgi:hypothetical protein
MSVAIMVLLGVITLAPLLDRPWLPRWVAPFGAVAPLTLAAVFAVLAGHAEGFGLAVTVVLTMTAAVFGGIPLPPTLFRIARHQPDSGELFPTRQGPLRGGRLIGVLERAAIAATVLAGWPQGMVIILGVKSLARYPDLRDSNVSEQFIIGTFTSVLWAIAVAAVGRSMVDLPFGGHSPTLEYPGS